MFKVMPYTTRRNRDIFDLFDDMFTDNTVYRGTMKMDIQDLEKEYVIEVDLPGILKDDVQIHFENERLIISVEREENKDDEDNRYIHKERNSISMKRSVYLKDVDPKKFKAKLDNGVLTINASKLEDKISKYYIDIE